MSVLLTELSVPPACPVDQSHLKKRDEYSKCYGYFDMKWILLINWSTKWSQLWNLSNNESFHKSYQINKFIHKLVKIQAQSYQIDSYLKIYITLWYKWIIIWINLLSLSSCMVEGNNNINYFYKLWPMEEKKTTYQQKTKTKTNDNQNNK